MKTEAIIQYDPALKATPERMLEVFAESMAKELLGLLKEAEDEGSEIESLRVKGASPQSVTLEVKARVRDKKLVDERSPDDIEKQRASDADEHARHEARKHRQAETAAVKGDSDQRKQEEDEKVERLQKQAPEVPHDPTVKKDFREGDHKTDILKNISK